MDSKFCFRTACALLAWLFLQNFNSGPTRASHSGFEIRNSKFEISSKVTGSYKIKKIVLDAGHGGKDPGCLGVSSTREKDNTLAIVLRLGEYIKANFPDVQVLYTRDKDEFIELKERAAIANRNNVDLFISVHCNSVSAAHISGAETYVMGLHTAQHNLEVAKRENASIYLEENYQQNYSGYDPNSPEAHIFGSMWQSAYLEQSILFAQYVQQYAKSVAGRDNKGVKQAGFLVLRETAMPSVLIETGYLTNRLEDEFIASVEGQDQMAEAIFHAFRAYKFQMEGGGPAAVKPGAPFAKPPMKPRLPAEKPAAATPVLVSTRTAPEKTVGPSSKASAATTASAEPVKTAKPAAPRGVRILLMSWPNKMDVNSGILGLLSEVREERAGGRYQYFVGPYKTRSEAEKMLPELQNLGFSSATIVDTP